jgi:hypothetical protein
MGFLDRLFGRREESRAQPAASPSRGDWEHPPDVDEQALQRYRYMLRPTKRLSQGLRQISELRRCASWRRRHRRVKERR